jgi:predicted membrane protein
LFALVGDFIFEAIIDINDTSISMLFLIYKYTILFKNSLLIKGNLLTHDLSLLLILVNIFVINYSHEVKGDKYLGTG